MRLFTKSDAPDTPLGLVERTAYMSGKAGISMINAVISTFLMFYYTDVMMLNAGILGTLLLISRVFDGVTDVVMGMVVDRTHSKHGKARAWVLWTCIPYAVSGVLLVCVPGGATEMVQYIYVFITYNLCNSICLTALYVPYNAMMVNMTTNPYERGLLGIFVMVGTTVSNLAVQNTIMKATSALGGDQRAWQIVVGIYALISLILSLFCFFFTKERTTDIKSGEVHKKVDIKLELSAVLKNKYWLIMIAVTFFALMFTSLFGTAGIYYAAGVLRDSEAFSSIISAMTLSQLVFLFLAFIPMKKFGKRNTILAGMALITLGCLIEVFLPATVTVTTMLGIVKGTGAGLAGAVMSGMVADTIDYGEWKTGFKAEGIGVAATTVATKVANGLAAVVVGWLLEIGQYDGAAAIQSQRAINALTTCWIWLPLFFAGVATVLLFFYNLDKIYPEIQKELEQRRNNKEEAAEQG